MNYSEIQDYFMSHYSDSAITFGDLVKYFKSLDQDLVFDHRFESYHSWRGHYPQVAFSIVEGESTVQECLEFLADAFNEEIHGYKGGTYWISNDTYCYATPDGSYYRGEEEDALSLEKLQNLFA